MSKSKFGTFVFLGAVLGGVASMLDKSTRENVIEKSTCAISTVQYYGKNTDELKSKIQEKKEKYETMFEKFMDDASYIKEKVDEIKQLTPQLQELVTDTKEAFVESKDEYKSIVAESPEEQAGK